MDFDQAGHAPALRTAWAACEVVNPAQGANESQISARTGQVEPEYAYYASYGMNAHYLNDTTGVGAPGEQRSFNNIPKMSILFGDGNSYGVINANLYPTIYGIWPRHLNSANYTFTDGHSETSSCLPHGSVSMPGCVAPWNPGD